MQTIIYNNEEVTIHNNANGVNVDNLEENIGNVYLVFEGGYGNSARISIVEAFAQDEAAYEAVGEDADGDALANIYAVVRIK